MQFRATLKFVNLSIGQLVVLGQTALVSILKAQDGLDLTNNSRCLSHQLVNQVNKDNVNMAIIAIKIGKANVLLDMIQSRPVKHLDQVDQAAGRLLVNAIILLRTFIVSKYIVDISTISLI